MIELLCVAAACTLWISMITVQEHRAHVRRLDAHDRRGC
jgi:hypothetical protein